MIPISSDPNEDSEETDNLITRSFSVDRAVWEQAMRKARAQNLSLSSIIRQLLKAWIEGRIQIIIRGDDDFLQGG